MKDFTFVNFEKVEFGLKWTCEGCDLKAYSLYSVPPAFLTEHTTEEHLALLERS